MDSDPLMEIRMVGEWIFGFVINRTVEKKYLSPSRDDVLFMYLLPNA